MEYRAQITYLLYISFRSKRWSRIFRVQWRMLLQLKWIKKSRFDSTKLSRGAMKWPQNFFLTWVQQFSWNIRHKLHTFSVYPLGQSGGQEFFGSSEECCSSWSGCCNSSCAGSCGDQQPLQQKLQDTPHQQPLSAAMVVMQVSSCHTVLFNQIEPLKMGSL